MLKIRILISSILAALLAAGISIAAPLQSLPYEASKAEGIILAAAGDVMLDRGVATAMLKHGESWPFSAVSGILEGADIAFVNLETSVSNRGRRMPGKGIWFRTKPERLGLLKDAGIDIVSAANNHIMDYDEISLLDTMSHLDDAGIAYVGAGADIASARMGRVITAGGVKVGFLAYSDFHDIFWSFFYTRTFAAGKNVPGMAPALIWMMQEDISRMKRTADFVVVSIHWGQEYMRMPEKAQIERAHAAIEAGADIVLGHHPHVLQPFEAYKGGLIFYSLGNFVFDQAFGNTTESMIARIKLSLGERPEAEITPLRITDGRPAPMSLKDARTSIAALRKDTGKLGTDLFTHMGWGYISAASETPGMLIERLLSESSGYMH